MIRRHIPLTVAVIALWACAALAQEPATAPAPAPSTRPDKQARLDALIEAIKVAGEPSAVVSAYAKASAIGPRDKTLNNAHMRRLLQLGMPQTALHSAQILVVEEPENGTAWGVVAYMAGKKGDYMAALSASFKAIANNADDASILNNTGQLLAWYDGLAQAPELTDSVKRILERKPDWLKKEPFAKAYKRVADLNEERAKQLVAVQQKIKDADAAVEQTREKITAAEGQLRDLQDQIDSHKDTLRDLRNDYWYTGFSDRFVHTGPGGQVVVLGTTNDWHRSTLLTRIKREERTIDDLKLQFERTRRDGKGLLGELAVRHAAADQLRREDPMLTRLQKAFRWDPPCVDGVMTEPLGFLPPVATGPANLPSDPQEEARRQLQLARQYIGSGLVNQGEALIKSLIEKYPDTQAAAEAKKLLSGVK